MRNGRAFSSDGKRAKAAFFGSFLPNIGRSAVGADKLGRSDSDEKFNAAGDDFLPKVHP